MPASPSLNMVWSSASRTLIGPLAFRFSPITPRSGPSVRLESIVASTPCRATDVRPFLSLFTGVRGRGILRSSPSDYPYRAQHRTSCRAPDLVDTEDVGKLVDLIFC